MQFPQQQYEKCPKHQQNDIVLFCLAGECKEPLCKDCCKLHVKWHNENGTRSELDTVDSVRQTLYQDVHDLKIKFEEERAILHHFSDNENSDLIKSVHSKLEKVRKTLQQVVSDYCHQLEEQIKQRILQHKGSHPGEKKELHHKLNNIIQSLDSQEKQLMQPKYIKACLLVISEEKNHDLEQFSREIDHALKHYLSNMFDVFVHDDKLPQIVQSIQSYVEIHQANFQEELDIYTKKLREGKNIYGYDQQQFQKTQPLVSSQIQKTSIYDYQPPTKSQNQYLNSQYIQATNPAIRNYESRMQSNNEKLRQQYQQ
ncbi:hypothetical protein pb186bvf_018828 [Paramecium bursaria]